MHIPVGCRCNCRALRPANIWIRLQIDRLFPRSAASCPTLSKPKLFPSNTYSFGLPKNCRVVEVAGSAAGHGTILQRPCLSGLCCRRFHFPVQHLRDLTIIDSPLWCFYEIHTLFQTVALHRCKPQTLLCWLLTEVERNEAKQGIFGAPQNYRIQWPATLDNCNLLTRLFSQSK